MKLTSEELKDIAKASAIIGGAFIWDDTPQGADYWGKVHNALEAMAASGRNGGHKIAIPEKERAHAIEALVTAAELIQAGGTDEE
jgi:hypothetical protein